MGVSMKEAAKSIPWEEMTRKAQAMASAVKKKMEEVPWDEIAEKAKATGVSMKDAAVSMGLSIKEAAEDRVFVVKLKVASGHSVKRSR